MGRRCCARVVSEDRLSVEVADLRPNDGQFPARVICLRQTESNIAALEEEHPLFDKLLAVEGNLPQRVVLPEASVHFACDNAGDLGGIAHDRQDAVFGVA